MRVRTDVNVAGLTDVGMERSVNQDYYGYYEPESDDELRAKGRLLVVCDGMGGHKGGEVASKLATETILEFYKAGTFEDPSEGLRIAVEKANHAVWDHAQRDPEVGDMGTTVVCVVLRGGMAYFAHVGDSRCYLIRNEKLHQVTLDHSLVQQMVLEGLIDEDEMEHHPVKNVILRALGVKPTVEVEQSNQPYKVGDLFMLSSDGLTGPVNKAECLKLALEHRDNVERACNDLVDLANAHGGPDNITVQIARVREIAFADESIAIKGADPNEDTAKLPVQDISAAAAARKEKPVLKGADSGTVQKAAANLTPKGANKTITAVMTAFDPSMLDGAPDELTEDQPAYTGEQTDPDGSEAAKDEATGRDAAEGGEKPTQDDIDDEPKDDADDVIPDSSAVHGLLFVLGIVLSAALLTALFR